MVSSTADIVNEAEVYVSELFNSLLTKGLSFHNFDHIKLVVKGVKKIGLALQLGPSQMEILLLAAWFHDTGYLVSYTHHEKHSMQIAEGFLKDLNYPDPDIQLVVDCIEATCMPQQPKTLLQMVLCDADLYHLSQADYCKSQQLLRKEWQIILDKTYTNQEWRLLNIQFLENHRYFTDYGQQVLESQKQENIQALK